SAGGGGAAGPPRPRAPGGCAAAASAPRAPAPAGAPPRAAPASAPRAPASAGAGPRTPRPAGANDGVARPPAIQTFPLLSTAIPDGSCGQSYPVPLFGSQFDTRVPAASSVSTCGAAKQHMLAHGSSAGPFSFACSASTPRCTTQM